MARASTSPDLDQVLGDIPGSPQRSDLDFALSDLGDLPPPPPSRSSVTKLGNELEDLLDELPADTSNKPPAPAPKPKPKVFTKSDQIMQEIYKLLAEIEVDIEKNLTPKTKLAKSDTFGLTSVIKGLDNATLATNSSLGNAVPSEGPKPPIKPKPHS